MYDAVIIKPLKKRGLFSVNPQFERTEAADVFYVRDNVRSLKKVVKYAGGRKIMPDSEMAKGRFTSQYVKKYAAVTLQKQIFGFSDRPNNYMPKKSRRELCDGIFRILIVYFVFTSSVL